MSNTDIILEFLADNHPKDVCDDCISKEAGIKPPQTVNQICNRLSEQGKIIRVDGLCAIRSQCDGRGKKVNTLARPSIGLLVISKERASSPPVQQAEQEVIPRQIDIEKIRTDVVHICQELWKKHKPSDAPPKSISAIINILKDEGVLPRHQANMMRTLCNLRNTYVWDRLQLGHREVAIAHAAWGIVCEWWKGVRAT
jgi:hypothetical protein